MLRYEWMNTEYTDHGVSGKPTCFRLEYHLSYGNELMDVLYIPTKFVNQWMHSTNSSQTLKTRGT